jgi:hypothetical protein
LVVFSTGRGTATSSLMSTLRARQHDNAPCPALPNYLLLDAASMRSVRLGTQAASVVRSYAHARRPFKCTLESRVGTYSGKGNGDYRSELASALRAITTYLKLFALTPEVALVRLDGQYGDAVAMAQRDFDRRVFCHTGQRISNPGASSGPACAGSPTDRVRDPSKQR